MKKFVGTAITALALLGTSGASAAGYTCENLAYRDAKLVNNNTEVIIQDTYFDSRELEKVLHTMLKGEHMFINQTALQVYKQNLKCVSSGKYDISCEAGTSMGSLTVQGFFDGGRFSIELPVEIAHYKLDVTSALGPDFDGRTITMIETNMEAQISLNNHKMTLNLKPHFQDANATYMNCQDTK